MWTLRRSTPGIGTAVTEMRWHEMTATEIQKAYDDLMADRDRWRLLAKHVCKNAPSIPLPDEIALLFPQPLPEDYDGQ